METTDAIEKLRRAVNDPGPNPAYHHAMKQKVRREWPTLWAAIEGVLAADPPLHVHETVENSHGT